jgi:hypothetical protein
MDLGKCPKVQGLTLRADYQLASKTKDYFYDVDVSFHFAELKSVDVVKQTAFCRIKMSQFHLKIGCL